VILGGAFVPPLGSVGLCLSVVSGLDGVAHVTVIADLVERGRMARGRLTPSFLPGLGTPGPQKVGAAARGVTVASSHQQGMRIRAIPIDGGYRLGWPRGCGAVL